MPSIAPGVFELKDSDESTWYRIIYLARVKDTLHVLYCFEKNTAKTEKRDLSTALGRWKQVQRRLREEQKHEKDTQRGKGAPHVTKGSVLDDLGFSSSEALEIKVTADLYRDLLGYIRERGFTQGELGTVLGIHQPDVSNLLTGKVSRFSVGKLIRQTESPRSGEAHQARGREAAERFRLGQDTEESARDRLDEAQLADIVALPVWAGEDSR